MVEKEHRKADGATEEVNGAATPLSLVVKLRHPIKAHGEDLDELKLREPTADDLEKIGNPVITKPFHEGEPEITFDEQKLTIMISTLAAIPPSSVKQLHLKDRGKTGWLLAANFFMPDLWSN
jgi:hypothetical protein